MLFFFDKDKTMNCFFRFSNARWEPISAPAGSPVNATFFQTHEGACGSCSPMQDWNVYAHQDLTTEARRCALLFLASKAWAWQCLLRIGFTPGCASTWLANIQTTASQCLGVCLANWFTPYSDTNACLVCDEQVSGAAFLRSAGRTRRNSGMVSEIQRSTQPSAVEPHMHLSDCQNFQPGKVHLSPPQH